MFKKLREKIVEEVRQSPIRFPGNDPFQAVSLGDGVKTESQGPKPEQFSITDDDGASSEIGSPYRGQNDVSIGDQNPEKPTETVTMQSHENDHFLFQYDAPQWPTYVPQSDIESEVDDVQSVNLDGVSKERLYAAAQKLHARVLKYKTKYAEVVKAYKDINDEKEKMKRALTDSQDKALRRMTELREQCSLEQQAKAHLEQNLRVMLEEKDEMIGVLETKIRLLKEGNGTPDSSIESSNETAIVDNLVDLGTSSPDSQAADLQEMQKKVKRLEELLGRCKETLRSNKERSTLLMQERDHLSSQLEAKEKEILQVQEKELEVQARLRGELSEVREQMKHLEKQQEESVMAMAETKQNMHQELESREQQLAQVKQELQTLQNEKEILTKKVEEKEMEVADVRNEQARTTKELEEQLQRTEVTLEEEKQSLMQELARGKAAAIALVQEESHKKLEQQENEWQNRMKEVEERVGLENEEKLAEARRQLEEAEKIVQNVREKKSKTKTELADVRDQYQKQMENTKLQLQQHQKEMAVMKQKQEENFQRSEQEQNAISQIEIKLQTLLGEKDKELQHISSARDHLEQQLTVCYQKTESLEIRARELEQERNRLSTELEDMKTVQHEVDEKNEEIKKLNRLVDSLRESRNFLQSKGSELIQSVALLQKEISSMRNLSNEFQNDANEQFQLLCRTTSDVQRENCSMVERFAKLTSSNMDLENKLKLGETENEELKLALGAMREEKDEIVSKTDLKWKTGFEESKNQVLKCFEENCEQYNRYLRTFGEKAMDILSARHNQLENLKGALLQLKAKQESSHKQKEATIEQLQNNIETKDNEIEDLRKMLSAADTGSSELSNLLHEKTRLENEMKEKYTTQIDDLINKSQQWKAKLQQTREQMNMQKMHYEARIEELEREHVEKLKMLNEDSESHKKTARELGELLKETEEQIASVESISLGWEVKFNGAQEETKRIFDQLAQHQESNRNSRDELENKLSSLEKFSEEMQQEIGQKSEAIDVLTQQLQGRDTNVRELEERITSIESLNQKNEDFYKKCNDELEQKIEDKNQELQILEEKCHQRLTEAENKYSAASKRLLEVEDELQNKEAAYQELVELKATSQQFTHEISILKEDLSKKESEMQDFQAIMATKDVLVQNLSDQLEMLQNALEDSEKLTGRIVELEENFSTLESNKDLEIHELEERLASVVAEFENSQIKVQELQEVIANNVVPPQADEEADGSIAKLDLWEKELERVKDEHEEELTRHREKLEDALSRNKNLEESESSLKSNRSFLEEQMKIIEDTHKQTVADLETKLELVSAQLDESLLVAQVNQASSTQEREEIKNHIEALQKEIREKSEELSELRSSNAELQETNKKLAENAMNGNASIRDAEVSEETRSKLKHLAQDFSKQLDKTNASHQREIANLIEKHQETESRLLWENNQTRTSLEQEMVEKAIALDEMQEHYQQQLQEKQEEIERLKESVENKKTETSDWDNAWEVEPVDDELKAHDKEHKHTMEEMQNSITKYQKEVADLRKLLQLTDGRPSIPDLNSTNENHCDTSLQPTEYEYLRNIMLEYMMGKEPLTLAKVISAVLRFTEDQTQQILMREEARQTSVK